VRWYFLGVGDELDIHGASFTGMTFQRQEIIGDRRLSTLGKGFLS
jgi:hypothetical protein